MWSSLEGHLQDHRLVSKGVDVDSLAAGNSDRVKGQDRGVHNCCRSVHEAPTTGGSCAVLAPIVERKNPQCSAGMGNGASEVSDDALQL